MDSAPGVGSASSTTIARAVLAAVRALPGVADVSPGLYAAAATYGPGEVVRGVAVRRVAGVLELELHLTAEYAPTTALPELADRVRSAALRAVETLGGGPVRRVDVAIDDVRIKGVHP
jgi:uncharacterized alkaline shock family protein YloU